MKAALFAHPDANERKRMVEGVGVTLPALCPAPALHAMSAAIDALPDLKGASGITASTSGNDYSLAIHVELEFPDAAAAAAEQLKSKKEGPGTIEVAGRLEEGN